MENKLNINDNNNIDKQNNTLVAIRVRPLNSKEKEESDYKIIKVISNNQLMVSIPTAYSFEEKGKTSKIKVTKERHTTFDFDLIFDENVSQSQVYELTSLNLIDQIKQGYNATILTYGAANTGKTYTMLGKRNDYGIIFRFIKDLFNSINDINNNDNNKFIIKISYIEIYNEIIKDLLNNNINFNNNNLKVEIKTDFRNGLILKNAILKKVFNQNEALKLIMKGNKKRTEKYSHSVLNIYIENDDEELINLNKKKLFSKIMFIDLAGNEKPTFNFNIKNKELGSINKSLLTLHKCINILAAKNKEFIPWHESNLTKILQESLIGNNKLVIIATISKSLNTFNETMFTLKFAEKIKKLKLNLKKNKFSNDNLGINKYDEFINNIKEEIIEVKKDIINHEKINENFINYNNSKINLDISENKQEIKSENDYDKIYKDISDHFQKEIKLKEKIIEKENIIEELKNETVEKEYELINSKDINLPPLQKQLKEKKEEIDDKRNKLLKGYIKQSELINKRKNFQKIISLLSKNTTKYHEYIKIYNMYKYNMNLLEKMNIEHKKNINDQETKRKDRVIEGLINQIDLRDKCIKETYQQIEKNNIEFKYQNPDLIKRNDIDSMIYKNSFNLNNNNEKNDDEKKENIGDGKKLILRKIKIKNLKNKNELDERTYNSFSNEKHGQYKNELFAIMMKSKNGSKINEFIRRNKNQNNINSINSYSLKNITTKNMNLNKPKNGRTFSLINGTSKARNKSMFIKFETELQKKVKTILKKNYISRYNKSPFLKNF